MEAAYLIDFYLAYESEMELSSIQHNSYFANEVNKIWHIKKNIVL